MRRVVIFLFSFHSFFGSATPDSIVYQPYRFSTGVNFNWIEPSPFFAWHKNRHTLGLGVRVGHPGRYGVAYNNNGLVAGLRREDNYGFKGLHFFYRINPMPPSRVLSFYFENSIYYEPLRNTINGEFFQYMHYCTEAVSLGFRIRFLKRFAFYQSFGIGTSFILARERYIDTPADPEYKMWKHSWRFGLGLSTGLEIGLF